MIKKNLIVAGFMTFACVTTALADGGHTFPAEGKTYLIHRFNNENSYIYESGTSLFASPKTNTQRQYWQFIPTEKENCYYIQNVTSKKYIQSTCTAENTQIKAGATPVEIEVKVNNTNGAAPKGYYYICSTDQTIDTSKDGSLGLNYQESTGKVVAYHIRFNRGNSYWDIVESKYDYEAPAPIERSEYSKRLGVYILPCGEQGDAYLKSLTVSGEKTAVLHPMNYTSAAKPSGYYAMVRKDSIGVVPGTTFVLNYEAANLGKDYTVTAYFDWNHDGIFETAHSFMNEANGQAEISVPADAALGKGRMRVRINDNGMDEADEDVHGQTYDFQLFTLKSNISTGVSQVTLHPQVKQTNKQTYAVDGRRVKNNKHLKGVFIQGGVKVVK